MLTAELKIYKDMYALFNLILDAVPHFAKIYKYTLGERLVNTALDCLELIQVANSDIATRKVVLGQFAVRFETLQLLLRVCRDRRQTDLGEYASMLELAGSIGKQATGWRKNS